ncbi:HlyD family secretion protein, partial [Niameybacter sp.]|uniref:HlyD family secretion protein n=2 Tax=Niameybacter sp. TaxID=2033640 RepID=UPI002FC6C3F6
RMKKYIGLVSLCIGGLGLVGCQQVEEQVEVVSVPVTKIEIEGVVSIEEKMEFNLDFPATVEAVHVKEGEKVKRGDVLMTLNIESYMEQITQKENEIRLYEIELKAVEEVLYPASAQITQIRNTLKLKQEQLQQGTDQDIKKLENDLEIARSQHEKGTQDFETLQALLEVEAVSKDEVAKSKLALEQGSKQIENLELSVEQTKQAKSLEIESLQAELKNLTTQASNTQNQIATNAEKIQLQIQTATIQLESMKNKLEKEYLEGHQIIAPCDDLIIYNIACQKGSKVERMVGPLMEGMNAQTLVIEADLPEEYNDDLQIGDKVEVLPYTNQDTRLDGTVIRKSEHATENYGETVIKTVIEIEDTKGLLTIGGNVDVQF